MTGGGPRKRRKLWPHTCTIIPLLYTDMVMVLRSPVMIIIVSLVLIFGNQLLMKRKD